MTALFICHRAGQLCSLGHDAQAERPFNVRRRTDVIPTLLFGVLPVGLLIMILGWPSAWPGILLALSASAFTLLWALCMLRRPASLKVGILGLALWTIGVHLALWLPFIFASYLSGQGVSGIAYAIFGTLITGTAVAWYVAQAHLWQTALLALALIGLVILFRRRKGVSR